MTEFNVNNNVWVRLTDEGRRVFTADQSKYPEQYRMRLEEVDGWSRWQLWHLMQVFGGSMFNGCRIPFETVIRLEAP